MSVAVVVAADVAEVAVYSIQIVRIVNSVCVRQKIAWTAHGRRMKEGQLEWETIEK